MVTFSATMINYQFELALESTDIAILFPNVDLQLIVEVNLPFEHDDGTGNLDLQLFLLLLEKLYLLSLGVVAYSTERQFDIEFLLQALEI